MAERYVRVDRIGREAFYELAEPLLRICVEAKTHRDRPLHLLVDFIRYWFSREELERRLTDANDGEQGRHYLFAALKEYDAQDGHVHLTPEISTLCEALTLEKDTPERLRVQAEELAELSRIAEDWGHYTRALIYLDKGLEGLPTLEKELKKSPNDLQLLRSLASVYASAQSISLAKQTLDRALEHHANSALLLWDRADLLAQTGDNKEALESYQQAEYYDPDLKPPISVRKARVLIKRKEYKAARDVLTPFLGMGKRIPGLFFVYGLACGYDDKTEEALLLRSRSLVLDQVQELSEGCWATERR